MILCEGGLITMQHLPLDLTSAVAPTDAAPSPVANTTAPGESPLRTVDAAERELIVQALAKSGNNKSNAARLLGLTRAQLRSRIEKHGLSSEG